MSQIPKYQFRFLYLFCLLSFLAACDMPDLPALNSEVNNAEESSENTLVQDQRKKTTKQTTHMYLGTGSVQGVYFPIGGVICRLLNRHIHLHRVRCTLESTGGSIYNLRQLREGNFDLVFAQSDWQYNAYHGKSTFEKDTPNQDLRAVFALEADPLAVIVKKNSDINEFNDLQDHVVSFGYARALQHRIIDDLLEVKGWTHKTFKKVRRMSDAKQVVQLCEGGVDAIVLLSSSLNDRLQAVTEGCELKLVPILGSELDQVIEQKPFYRKSVITKGSYLNSESDTPSFGLGATFVASKDTSPKAIYHIVKEVVENFNDFKSLHPSLEGLRKKDLPYAGISIPLHPGATRYYKEAGLIKK